MATGPARDDAHEAQAIRDKHGIPAYLPVCASDDDRRASKLGGAPWLDEPWPICPTCENPLRFVLQLRRDDVPPSCQWAFGADLIQLILCDASGKPDSPGWLCQAGGHGWEPFAPSTLVRQVDLGGEAIDLATAMPIEVRLNVARLEHAARADFMQKIGMAQPAAPADLSARAAPLLEFPESPEAFVLNRPWLFPVQRFTSWQEQLDIPEAALERWRRARLRERLRGGGEHRVEQEVDRAYREVEGLGLVCERGDTLAGSPAWVQDERTLACRRCGAPMRHLFQISSGSPVADAICDGTGWLFVCPDCHEGTYTWQR